MENQIPFQILVYLITLIFDDGEDKVSKFLQRAAWDTSDEEQHKHIKQQLEESSPLHLLGALHEVLVWDDAPKSLQDRIQSYIGQKRIGDMHKSPKPDTGDTHETPKTDTGDLHETPKADIRDIRKTPKAYRSAKDLKAKGLHFRPSSRRSLKAIEFNSFGFCGKLELPPQYASSLSKVVFLNLIAYELCPNNVLDFTVICYVNFMKSLNVSPDDVKELREKKVLLTSWTDEAVVRFFEDLDTFDIEAVDKYMDVKQNIQKHYDSIANKWMAELFYTHFSTPWHVIAWSAGVVLLVLTVVQTYFTTNPK
ncbi:hypothetical protein CDL12_23791 [Handroanthus impetiginosus]|uniref:Uncharacterized protein n=1 Tax=Handroanthus impetiginosus TaxID=429701 RepID=A0A2G9GF93_9LAMI|nr:hypothetical protein CDL12_23791 [Handroanthus impetiginosus]